MMYSVSINKFVLKRRIPDLNTLKDGLINN